MCSAITAIDRLANYNDPTVNQLSTVFSGSAAPRSLQHSVACIKHASTYCQSSMQKEQCPHPRPSPAQPAQLVLNPSTDCPGMVYCYGPSFDLHGLQSALHYITFVSTASCELKKSQHSTKETIKDPYINWVGGQALAGS